MDPRRQSGRLYELPILGAILVVAGVWISKYHPAGLAVAALPIVVWLGLLGAGLVARLRIGARRGRVVRGRLAALQAEGFSPQLVCEGDLARGDAWAAFDATKGEAKILSEEGVRSYELSRLGSVTIDEARRLGDPTPLYYSLRLYFGDPNAPFKRDALAGIVTTSRREAERWQQTIREFMGASHPPDRAGAA